MEMSNMTLLINCICMKCGNTSTCMKEVGIDAVMPVCALCDIEMRDVFDVAVDCVKNSIMEHALDELEEKFAKAFAIVSEIIPMKCPFCEHEFDFFSIAGNKNMWNVLKNNLLVQCPECAEWSKIDMSD